MILTTTPSIEGFKIADYLGIVTGVCMKARDFSAFGSKAKQSEQMEKSLNAFKEEAFQELQNNAKVLGANAIVGISVDFEPVGQGFYFGVSVTGTAVKVAY